MIKKGIRIGAETGQLNISRFARQCLCLRKRTRTAKAVTGLHCLFPQQKSRQAIAYLLFWCGKRDLNPYGVNHTPLKRARLPVPPLPRVRLARNILYYTLFFQNVKWFLKKNQNFLEKSLSKILDKSIDFVYNIEVVNRRHNLRVWRNWQTRQIQVLVGATS